MKGRVALVTGVSRRAGIGFAIARRLAERGVRVFAHHHVPHDAERAWGADPGGIEAVLAEIGGEVADAGFDLAWPDAPEALFAAAAEAFGHIDILVCNHASSGPDGSLAELTAELLDAHWAINTRSSLLLAKAFAAQHDDARAGGRIVFMTSGQHLGPMPGEVAYAASKGALAAITLTLADELADRGITVNCVNPGPVDTGWATPELFAAVTDRLPAGRWGEPDDAARLIAWLASDDGRWMTGQVLDSEGGFRRWASARGGGDPDAQRGGQSRLDRGLGRRGDVARQLSVRLIASEARQVAIDARDRIVVAGEACDDEYEPRDDLGQSHPAVARLHG